jgi:hypothetical protein
VTLLVTVVFISLAKGHSVLIIFWLLSLAGLYFSIVLFELSFATVCQVSVAS